MPAAKNTLVVKFSKERETKNTVRFAEDADPDDQVIRTLYVTKDALADIGNPESLTVTIK